MRQGPVRYRQSVHPWYTVGNSVNPYIIDYLWITLAKPWVIAA